jgi:hypothetical protein
MIQRIHVFNNKVQKFNKKLDPNHWVKKIQNEQFNPELIKYKHALSF